MILSAVISSAAPSGLVTTILPGPSSARLAVSRSSTLRAPSRPLMPAAQRLEDLVLARLDLRPVDADAAGDVDAHLAGVLDVVQQLGRGQQRLGRNAAVVQAGAAEVVLLDDGDARAHLAGLQRRDIAAGPAADHRNVEMLTHVRSLFTANESRNNVYLLQSPLSVRSRCICYRRLPGVPSAAP